jgi:AI-2 transport protein TqsA
MAQQDEPASHLPEASIPTSGRGLSGGELTPLVGAAAGLFLVVGGWYLLKELAPLLRPLVLAVFLAYTIVPAVHGLRRRMPARFASAGLVLVVALAVVGSALLVYKNLVELRAELPRLIDRARFLMDEGRTLAHRHVPAWAFDPRPASETAEVDSALRIRALASSLVNTASSFIAEAFVVAFYLIFLLMEAKRLPQRVREGFSTGQAERVLAVVGSVNAGISSYLRAKALASLITAVPVVVVLAAFGVSFPVMWGVLAFVGNFIPYVGTLVAFVLPILLAFLELDALWQPVTVLVLLLLSQFVINNLIEPRITAKAVDLSPLVVLIALGFWGLCWGLVGMVLAVPLTVVLKIVMQNIPLTRPLARLMAEE